MRVAGIETIPRKQLREQTILVRIDASDDARMRDSLPTITFLSESGARVVIATHSPSQTNGSQTNGSQPGNIAARLTELLGGAVYKPAQWKGEAGLRAVTHMDEGEIIVLENLAFEPGEKAADDRLADALAHLCDIYCNDAFALSHEVRASTVGVARRARLAVAGFVFEREWNLLSLTLDDPPRPLYSILGGKLTKEKLLLAEEISRHSDSLFVAGEMAFPFIVAKGHIPGCATVTDEMVRIADRMMTEARDDKRDITTPVDFTVIDKTTFEQLSRGERFPLTPPLQNVTEDELEPYQVICDIGRAASWSWSDSFGAAGTIFWHGPVGISEIDLFGEATRFLAAELANRSSPTLHHNLVCGKSLVAAIRRAGIETERIRHITPAGRVALHYFAGRPLPAVEALSRSRRQARILIPLNGTESDAGALHAAAEMVTRETDIFFLHVRQGPDEEQYPDLVAALGEAEKYKRRIESERIFARAKAVLASRGLISAGQFAATGEPAEIILRYASLIRAELIALGGGANEVVARRRVIDHATCAVFVARPNISGLLTRR